MRKQVQTLLQLVLPISRFIQFNLPNILNNRNRQRPFRPSFSLLHNLLHLLHNNVFLLADFQILNKQTQRRLNS